MGESLFDESTATSAGHLRNMPKTRAVEQRFGRGSTSGIQIERILAPRPAAFAKFRRPTRLEPSDIRMTLFWDEKVR